MRKLKIVLAAAALLAVAFFFTPLVQYLAGPLVTPDPLAKADAIVVLAAGWEAPGQLSASSLAGYQKGIELFQENYGQFLIFAGGSLSEDPSPAQAMAEKAYDEGFSQKRILFEPYGETTWQEALFVKRLLLENKLDSVIVVTPDYQTRLAKAMFTELGIPTSAAAWPSAELDAAPGLRQLPAAKAILAEYAKYLAFSIGLGR